MSGGKFYLRRAVEADLDALVELLTHDPLRRAESSAAPEHYNPYLAAFRAIEADPEQLLVVLTEETETVVATNQLTAIPGLARAGATRLNMEAVRVDERQRQTKRTALL